MKKLSFLLTFTLALVFGCNNQPQKIEITPDILISMPQKCELTVKDSPGYLKIWETYIEDDHFAVFRYSINQQESSGIDAAKQAFKKNIDAFLETYDFKNIDSTFTYNEKFMQSDLNFDYLYNENDYRFYARFLVKKQNFIAFCFQTPYPLDNYSKRTKDKLFASIEIK